MGNGQWDSEERQTQQLSRIVKPPWLEAAECRETVVRIGGNLRRKTEDFLSSPMAQDAIAKAKGEPA